MGKKIDAVLEAAPKSASALPEPEATKFVRGDHELRLFRWPRPGAPRVLLVHGIGMGHSVYDRFVSKIAEHTDVTAVDLPGFGESPEPAEPLSIAATADLLALALAESGLIDVTAVGHSMGSQIVAELAARHPFFVKRVVLIAPTVNPAERSVRRQSVRMLQDFANGEPASALWRGLISYMQTGPRWFIKKLGPTLAHRIERTLPLVAQPTLVLRGSIDAVCPRGWAVRVTGLLPHGEMQQLQDRGHEALIASGEPAAQRVLDWMHRMSHAHDAH